MIHFAGAGNLEKAIRTGNFDKPLDNFGTSIKSYIKHQTGGYAGTEREQYEGLNNPNYDEMIFPMEGYNTFRGLDNGQPVHLQEPIQEIELFLMGPKDTAKMHGTVKESKVSSRW